jgi:Uma2 family endonuclease
MELPHIGQQKDSAEAAVQDDGGREAPMSTQPRPRMSPAEYLAAERRAETRHEYFAGEVLSPSTEDHDRGRKAWHYRRVASLEEYVLASQDEPLVERHRRQGDGEWLVSELRGTDASLELGSVDCTLTLGEIYDGT